MGNVIFDISMSLDGFIAGMSDGGERLPEWGYALEVFRERLPERPT
jgi:hypothetical protein